jgi:hypothetical protein
VIAVTALARFLAVIGPDAGLTISTTQAQAATATSASMPVAPASSLADEVSGWTAARRLAGDLACLDDLVVAAWKAEEALLELRAGQVGVPTDAVQQRDQLLTGLIALVRGVPQERVALTSPAHTAATSPVPSTAGGTR